MQKDSEDKLLSLLKNVKDEVSFIRFIKALSDDWEDDFKKEQINPSSQYGSSANGWENGTIGAFLESASAFGHDTAEQKSKKELENIWYRSARIIYAGKHYE